jgi:hypothetical protein
MNKILALATFIIALMIPLSYSVAQYSSGIQLKKAGWGSTNIQTNQYNVSIIPVADMPEAYYILDTRVDLCFFVVSTMNGISTTRVPCKPFLGLSDALEDKHDECK